MARQRFIHPDIWTDPSFGQLTPQERLLFIGCFSNADDEGRLLGNPAYLRATIFPYDDLSLDEVKAMRDHIVAICKNLVLYEVDGLEYLAFLKWNKYQKPKYPKPSKLPPPPIKEDSAKDVAAVEELQTKEEEKTEETAEEIFTKEVEVVCGNIGETFPQNSGKDGETMEKSSGTGLGMGRDIYRDRDKDWDRDEDGYGKEKGDGEPTPPTPPPPPTIPEHTEKEREMLKELKVVPGYPFDFSQDLDYIRNLMVEFPSLDLLTEIKKWRIYKRDKPLKPKSNARLQLRNWCEKALQFQQEKGAKANGQRGPNSGTNEGKTIDIDKFLWKGKVTSR
ncbi:hypothetical protein [Thermoanaerobacterium sp. DL9XJH110]|uniref:hypothetical protein n=1 Tax=Thermoanaerobacterium sp. DL9XJH110 TaxID=3386643 RepID=UPI003BB73972